MTVEDLVKALSDAKFDVHLGKAPDGTACPYVVLSDLTHPNFATDNKTHAITTSIRLVLVEAGIHNYSLIGTLEGVLDTLSLPYSSEDVYEPSEGVCETYYDIRFLGGNTNA